LCSNCTSPHHQTMVPGDTEIDRIERFVEWHGSAAVVLDS
jgi:hypothetical protein